jgi:D-3-phosphoglycerate dehydrogenase
MKKLVVLDGSHYPEGEYREVGEMCEKAGIAFAVLDCKDADDAAEKAKDADAAMCVYLPMDAPLLKRLPRLKMVVRCGIGVDNLNLPDFTACGVYACNVPDYGVEEVAVHALGLILSLERKIPFYNFRVHSGDWREDAGYDMRRLSLRTVGMLGFGRIARKLGELTRSIGYGLIAYDPFLPDEEFTRACAGKVDLDTLFKESDVVVVMAPVTEETIRIVNAENLSKAKDGLFVVNTARGTLIDTSALISALRSGKVAGAALDVLEEEPPRERCLSLLGMDNVILTPHIAYRSVESFEALKRMAGATAIEFLKHSTVNNLVNRDVLNKARA